MEYSVVITTYNRLNLLKRAIDSALQQTLPCEVIIVDDCSSDGTEEYIQSLGNQVIYHRNPRNMGHSASVNAGVDIASGDWIKLLDDDDYLSHECMETMDKIITNNPNIVICSCQALQVDINSNVFGQAKIATGNIRYIPQVDIHYLMFLDLLPFGTPTQVAFQKDAFMKSGGWDSAFDYNYDDIICWIKITKYGDAILLDKYLAYRMVWPGSINKKISFQERLNKNILIKEKIIPLVSSKYTNILPTLEIIEKYLRLHWGLISAKNKNFSESWQILSQAIFSPPAWQLFLKTRLSRKFDHLNSKT